MDQRGILDWDCWKDRPVSDVMSITSVFLDGSIACYLVVVDLVTVPRREVGVQGVFGCLIGG